MVTRVDNVLRDELHVEDGLADPRVHVLDTCCGTGKYLVEVLRKIDERLSSRVRDGLTANDVKAHTYSWPKKAAV
jgi:predicted helicase